MIYKFYDEESFMRQNPKDLLKCRFAISSNTYQKVLNEDTGDLLFILMTSRNKFDICHVEHIDTNEDIPVELALAIQYDNMYHPDETIFVTCNEETADIANRYFGEDSIELLK
jgi:hypothetical protein